MPAALLAADTADTNKPLIVVIGNSMQDEGIHFPTLEKGLNAQIENVWISGSASCWKFAKLWHYIHHWEKQGLTRKPDYVVVISRENFITHTARRTTHEYVEPIAEAIDGDKDLQAIIDSVLKIGAGRYSTWDFDSVIENSFLHQMILAADSAGVQFIFARHRVEKDARNPFWSDSCGGREYRDSLAKYLKSHNVPFLDYSLNPELMVEYYNIGDHLFWPGKTAWNVSVLGAPKKMLGTKSTKE